MPRSFNKYVKNKYYSVLKDLPACMRNATVFQKICEEIPLSIGADDLLAGLYYIVDDYSPYQVKDEKEFPFLSQYTDEEFKVKEELENRFVIKTNFDLAHTCINYGNVLKNGFIAYERRIKDQLSQDVEKEKREMLNAMLIALDGARTFASRFAELAGKAYEESGERKFLRMQRALEKVPYNPCETFYEAVSAVWILHSLVPLSENSWSSISVGRMDQYLFPYYQNSLNMGESREQLKSYLINLFKFFNTYGDGACALNIGGADENGNDQINDLSKLILEVEKEVLDASPIVAVRVNPNTPEDFLDECIDERLFGIGQPTFYGELPCRKAMELRGLSKNDAVDFSVNSCMGLHKSGAEISSMWACIFNMHLPLELAVNNGKGLLYDLPFAVTVEKTPNNLEELLLVYEKYLERVLTVCFSHCVKNDAECAVNNPNPFLSMLTDDCIKNGLDRAVGAKYNTETVEAIALANTANAIYAINTLVFEQKKYALKEYVEATKKNFVGCEGLLVDIRNCAKYGMNDKEVDSVALKLCRILWKICKKHDKGNRYFVPSLHTLDANVWIGEKLYATLDGRLSGMPVAKNAGATNDVRSADPTNLLISASSLEQEYFSGGQPVDLYFAPKTLNSKEKRDKIKALIKTYFQLGGLQLQVNSVNVDLLEKAYETPEQYTNLVVRIGGYSNRFVYLSKRTQLEFIERFKQES